MTLSAGALFSSVALLMWGVGSLSDAAENGCLNVTGAHANITLEGRLTVMSFPGPPNYRSIEEGDREERAFILELQDPICIEDGGDFADLSETFTSVHVSSYDPTIIKLLKAYVGRNVVVSGKGFASQTGHHHAPIVIMADSITVQS